MLDMHLFKWAYWDTMDVPPSRIPAGSPASSRSLPFLRTAIFVPLSYPSAAAVVGGCCFWLLNPEDVALRLYGAVLHGHPVYDSWFRPIWIQVIHAPCAMVLPRSETLFHSTVHHGHVWWCKYLVFLAFLSSNTRITWIRIQVNSMIWF